MISANRLVRTRMLGGVGAGGENPPATRLFIYFLVIFSSGTWIQMNVTSVVAAVTTKQRSLLEFGSGSTTKNPGRLGWYPWVVPIMVSPSRNTTLIFRPATGMDGSKSFFPSECPFPTKSLTKNTALRSLTKTSIGFVPGAGGNAGAVWRRKRS